MKDIQERGSASMNIDLTDGIITVRHGDCNSILVQWVAKNGDWNSLFEKIKLLEGGLNNG